MSLIFANEIGQRLFLIIVFCLIVVNPKALGEKVECRTVENLWTYSYIHSYGYILDKEN